MRCWTGCWTTVAYFEQAAVDTIVNDDRRGGYDNMHGNDGYDNRRGGGCYGDRRGASPAPPCRDADLRHRQVSRRPPLMTGEDAALYS